MGDLINPEIELDRAFMPVLVTSNFDDYSIENERASMETPFSHYKSIGNYLDAQGKLTPRLSVAMDTRVLSQTASKHYAAFPTPSDAIHKM